MNDIIFNNLDRLLLQFVFQLQQASYVKEHKKQQIQIYTANIVGEKAEICQLQEDINKNDEVIISLRKRNNNSKENCNAWKPTYVILNKHEEYLKKELQKLEETTEKDKKMYQGYMNQYQETFNQHQAKYLETVIAQEYYQEKKAFEEIQNRILKQSELLKQKEAEVIELQEPGPFQSLSSWASQIASLRQNTKETLTHAVLLRQQSLELNITTEELEKKMNYFKQQLEKITEDQNDPEDQNHHEVTEGGIAKNIETRKTFDESLFKETRHLLNEKHQTYKLLHLPNISQKLVRSVPTLKPLFQHTQRTGVEEKEDPAPHSAMTSMYFSQVENENQNCNDITGTDTAKTAQVSSKTSLPNQTKPFRLLGSQTQTSSKQWFESEATEIAGKMADYTGRREEETSKDSAYISQDGQAESCIKSTGHRSIAREEDAENFPRTPEPNIFPKTPDSSGVKTPFELLHSEGEGSVSKSPAFSFLTGFTTKSPGFDFFDSSAFGAEMSLDKSGDNSSTGNLNPISPCKDIGDLFGKMDREDSFAFSFPSCSSAQAFQDGKDDFRFPFAFGSSQPASLKGFQASSQSRKPFSLF